MQDIIFIKKRGNQPKRVLSVRERLCRAGIVESSIPVPKIRKKSAKSVASLLRDSKIIFMVKSGMTYTDIGEHFGLSRERIRVIADKLNVSSVRSRKVYKSSLDDRMAAYWNDLFNLEDTSNHPIHIRCMAHRKFGITKTMRTTLRIQRQTKLFEKEIEMVKNGYSYYQAAGCQTNLSAALQRLCKTIGVKSQHPSYNPKYRQNQDHI